jgi:AcrR family transcriptional regulator
MARSVKAAPAREEGKTTHTTRGETQRQALVNAAFHLIAEGGFERLRTREVAARAGMNIATLHYYFATKEDLIRGVVDDLKEQFVTIRAPSAREETQTPLERLRQEFVDLQYHLGEMPETYVVLLELYMRSLRDPVIHAILGELDARWHGRIRAHLTDGVRQGMFRPDLDLDAATAAIVSLLRGGTMQLLADLQPFPIERIVAEIEHMLTNPANDDHPPR